jgi:hypothetical protein
MLRSSLKHLRGDSAVRFQRPACRRHRDNAGLRSDRGSERRVDLESGGLSSRVTYRGPRGGVYHRGWTYARPGYRGVYRGGAYR